MNFNEFLSNCVNDCVNARFTSKETEEGWSYSAYREDDGWAIECIPPGQNGFVMSFTTLEGMSQALEELTGESYAEFSAAAGLPGLLS